MKRPLAYSTKYIDNELKRLRSYLENAGQGTGPDLKETLYQRLDQRIAAQDDGWIVNSLHDLFFYYAGGGDSHMYLDVDTAAAKESYHMAASIGVLCYEMIEKGVPHHVLDSGYPFDHKKHNFNFARAPILANEYEMALKITGTDTVEGALLLRDDRLACALLPESPEDPSINEDEIRQCMWAIAHGEGELFNKYLEKRIKMLRRYGRLDQTLFDGWGAALVNLARQREIECRLDVIELPCHLLDDSRIDASRVVFPWAGQIRAIIQKSGAPAG